MDEALKAKRFWRLWNTQKSEEMLRSVYRALTEALGLGMHAATVLVRPPPHCHAALPFGLAWPSASR